MIDAPAPTPATALTKQQKLIFVGMGLALGLIFAGVLLHVFFPSRGEPLAPPPAVSYPSDVAPEEGTGDDQYYEEPGEESEGEEAPPGAEPL